jgi:hypothetical protein
MGSPVSIDSSTGELPATTTPSTGTFSPGRTRIRSPRDDLCDGHVLLDPVANDASGLRLQADERADGRARLPLGSCLQHAAEQDERDDEGRRVEVHRHAQALMLEESREQHAEHAVQVGGRGAHGDERVHGGRAVAQGRPGRRVELPAHPELHDAG